MPNIDAPRTIADLPAPSPEAARRIVALLDGARANDEEESA